jgi:hypothetical protein
MPERVLDRILTGQGHSHLGMHAHQCVGMRPTNREVRGDIRNRGPLPGVPTRLS